jgi:rSAM/selenodomain-associated transferase 1
LRGGIERFHPIFVSEETMTRNAIIVFCKPPVAGRVKTRLIGALSARQAAEVHAACVRDTLAMARGVPGAQKWLYVAAGRADARRLAKRLRLEKDWKIATQRGADLGERMLRAIEEQLRAGAEKVVIVGTDSPWMGRERIERAIKLLDKSVVVLGPCVDGGYYLLAARQVIPKSFWKIRWGTASVLAQTLRALRSTRTTYHMLKRDFDLDRPEDLQRVERMAARKKLRAPALAKWVRESSRRREPRRQNKKRRPGRG